MLNQNIAVQYLVLNAFTKRLPLALFLAVWQKYTFGAAMESAIRPPFHKLVSSVSGVIYQKIEGVSRPAIC